MNKAVDTAFGTIDYDSPDFDFVSELKYNNAVFAAFKTHRQQNDLAQMLLDENDKLKTFEQFSKDSEKILVDYNKNWLRTEYNTAVIRARMAAKFKQFEREADLYPNLMWQESTSAHKRDAHVKYYGLILPIEHPFWQHTFPGSLWNCKCGITNTDEPANGHLYGIDDNWQPAPAPAGLEGNPAFTGKIYSDKNPYQANRYKNAPKAVKRFLLTEFSEDNYKLKLWIERVLFERKARNKIQEVGVLDKKLIRFAKAHKIPISSKVVVLTDKRVLHMQRDAKANPLSISDMAKIRDYLAVSEIYFDTSKGNFLYFTQKNNGLFVKIVITQNYTVKINRVITKLNAIVTAGYANAAEVNKSEFVKIK